MLVALSGLLALSTVVVPVLAHANTLEADAQVSPDGTVIAESVFVFEDAWLVVHRDDGGAIGGAIGHTLVRPNRLATEVPVEINRSVWNDWRGARPVHLALHHDDGDGSFDPADDPILSTAETTAASRLVVAPGTERVAVHAANVEAKPTNGSVTVRRASLPEPGFLVLHPPQNASQPVGRAEVGAGVSESVTISIREAFYRQQDRRFDLSIALYRDDGNGEFDANDAMIRAGDEAVSTTITLERTDDRTPVPTTEGGDGHDHEHTGETEEHHDQKGSTTREESGSHTHEDGEGHDHATPTEEMPTETAGADGAGPGPLGAILAVVVGLVVLGRLA